MKIAMEWILMMFLMILKMFMKIKPRMQWKHSGRIRMDQDGSGRIRMDQDGSGWIRMDQDGSEWIRTD